MPSARFFLLLALLTGAAAAAGAALVFNLHTWEQARALDGITRHLDWHIRNFSAAEWRWAQFLSAAGALLLAAASGAWLNTAAGRREAAALGRELAHSALALGRGLARLPRPQRRGAGLALAGLTAGRLYFSLSQPPHPEEIGSYLWFASRGLLAATAYYPNPNNHVLSNVLAGVFHQLSPEFWFTMRLPVLLVATAGTAGLFALTRRAAGFWPALLGTALFAGLQLSWYFAAAGRGYWLVATLAGLVLYAALALGTGTRRPRAAWAALLLAALLGGLTLPAFAYPAAAAWLWLGWRFRRRGRTLMALAGTGAVLVAAAALLYAPLLLVSGPVALARNPYVAARTAAAFWPALPAHVQLAEGMVAGQGRVGLGLSVLVLAASWRWLRGPLPPLLRWWVLAPYALLLAQRVLPPERVLLYKSVALFLLLGLLVSSFFRSVAGAARRRAGWALGLPMVFFLSYQLYQTERINRVNRRRVANYRAAWQWLTAHPPGPALAPESLHRLYFQFFATTTPAAPPRPLDSAARPGRTYRYVLAFPNRRGAFQPRLAQPAAFRNAEVEVFVLP